MRIFVKSYLKLVVIILSCFSFILFGFTNSNNTLIPPKNIILLIIDGCGFNNIVAADFYEYGKTGVQQYEKFPIKYAMSTYSLNGNGYSSKEAWTRFDYVNNKLPQMEWHIKRHTNSLVPFFAKGKGSDLFNNFADEIDLKRGKYIDNAELGEVILKLLK